jgi:phytoene desaturase
VAKVLVIGAGMGGMACAARLAVKGHKVLVVEQGNTYGGKLTSFQHGESKFDLGPTLLHFPAVYRDLFLKTGAALEESIELFEVTPTFKYFFSDRSELELPGLGVGDCAQAIDAAFGATSGQEWLSLIRRGSQIWSLVRKPYFESDQNVLSQYLSIARSISTLRKLSPFKSLRAFSKTHLSDPRLIQLVDHYALESGSDPRKASAWLSTKPYLEQTLGAYQIVGGISELGKALFERCLQLGVEFKFDTKVVGLCDVNPIRQATTTSGEALIADIFITNFDPRFMESKSPRSAGLDMSISGMALLIELDTETHDLAPITYFAPINSGKELDLLFNPNSKLQGRSDFSIKVVKAQSGTGKSALTIHIPAPALNSKTRVEWTDSTIAAEYRERILTLLSNYGFDLKPRITWEKVLTPVDFEAQTLTPHGSLYGYANTGTWATIRHSRNRSKHSNLFVVGDTTHPGSGLPQVGISAELVAERIGTANPH